MGVVSKVAILLHIVMGAISQIEGDPSPSHCQREGEEGKREEFFHLFPFNLRSFTNFRELFLNFKVILIFSFQNSKKLMFNK